MIETVGASVVFVVLLGIEWRYKLRSVRIGAVALALIVWLFSQPGYTTAARRVIGAPPEERITQLRGAPLSEYESGVTTMYDAIDDVVAEYFGLRMLALAVLVWLACSPALGRAHAKDAARRS